MLAFVIVVVIFLVFVFVFGPLTLQFIIDRIEDWRDIVDDIKDSIDDWRNG